jgi:hypothetical protein
MLNTKRAQGLLKNHFVNPPTNLSIDWNRPKTVASAFNVPKIIHYIWVGENRIPDSGLRNIYRMAHVNCSKSFKEFKIIIWTDNTKRILDSMQNAEQSDDLILSQLARNNKDDKIIIKHYSVLFKYSGNQNIADHKVKLYLEGLVIRNLYGPFRNYACASDILRLFALNLGGIYLDVDVAVIDKIPESCLTSEYGISVYCKDGFLQNNFIIAAPNDWIIKNLLMLICKQHEHVAIKTRYGDQCFSTDEQLNETWHQQRSLQTHIDSNGRKLNVRKISTMMLTGPGLYFEAYSSIYSNYQEQWKHNIEALEVARNALIESRKSRQLTFSEEKSLSSLSSYLKSTRLLEEEEFYSRYWLDYDIFNNHEAPQEYAKLPEAHKPFFAHGVVKGVAPSGDADDKLDSWCKVDTNTKHHDTSDIPV